jgi:hypothetical protein
MQIKKMIYWSFLVFTCLIQAWIMTIESELVLQIHDSPFWILLLARKPWAKITQLHKHNI